MLPAVRDATVDMLRGIAVVAMVWGHLGVSIFDPSGQGTPGVTLQAPPPLWTEVFGGIAPALFLFVCGVMVAYSYRRGARLSRQLIRMGLLFVVGATIDVLFWRIRPFTTVDVLYCIALALPLCHLFVSRLPSWARWPLVLGVFAATPLLQRWLGYADYPTEYTIWGKLVMDVDNQTSIFNHWIIDGWFPIFPWVGFALLGSVLGARRWDTRRPTGRDELIAVAAGAGLLLLGVALGWPDPAARSILRLNAGGAFMPPDVGYVSASIGSVLLLLALCDRIPASRARDPLILLGMAPLFLYISHYPLIWVVSGLLSSRLTIGPGIAVIALSLAVLAAVAWAWIRVRGPILEKITGRPRDVVAGDQVDS